MGLQENEKKERLVLDYENKKVRQPLKRVIRSLIFGILILAVLFIIIQISLNLIGTRDKNPEVITISTLKKMVNASELSTFKAVYNGVAVVMNEKEKEEIDYHVSYEAEVLAGFDFDKLEIDEEKESKTITLIIPEIVITDVNVDIGSLDYIFKNSKANKITVSDQAYDACIADVTKESEQESAILDLAG